MSKKNSVREINEKAYEIISPVKLLSAISWPDHLEAEFLSKITKKKKPKISFEYEKIDMSEEKEELKRLIKPLSRSEPTHIYTRSTIESYLRAFEMIENVGTGTFQALSVQEYGVPDHFLFESDFSHLDAAHKILEVYKDFDHPYLKEPELCFSAEQLKDYLESESKKVFGDMSPNFEVSDKLTAKASAGRERIRLRAGTCFTEYDFDQLLVHEVMTHTLTALNGNAQPELKLLGQGAPRTTKIQEGLATFSEVITGNMDLTRLKRLALRVIAIDKALNGADFYDLFDFFKDNDQSDKESFLSASRILRGGSADGGIVFNKDSVYVVGILMMLFF